MTLAKKNISTTRFLKLYNANKSKALAYWEQEYYCRQAINFNAGIAIELNNIFGPHMVKNNLGRIVHISSSNALSGGTTSEGEAPAPAYTCAKSFLNMYSKVLGRELAKNNIIVSCVIPGVLKSEGKYWDRLSKNNPELVKNYLKNHHAIGRFGQFSEIAPFVLFMASKHATFAASANLNIDGGYI